MTTRSEISGAHLERHCIEVDLGHEDIRTFTVADHEAVQQQRYDQPL